MKRNYNFSVDRVLGDMKVLKQTILYVDGITECAYIVKCGVCGKEHTVREYTLHMAEGRDHSIVCKDKDSASEDKTMKIF